MTDAGDNCPGISLLTTDRELPEPIPVGFEKYTDFEPINSGATSALDACFDTIVGRRVVIKRLIPRFANDPRERRRLLREARITAQLPHPNTVPVYEIGSVNGEVFFTMKRLAGENLFKVLQRLSWGDATTKSQYPLDGLLDIVIQSGLALAYAHQHGVIHRDIKPENIWLGAYGEILLLDWGVAKVVGVDDEIDEGGPSETAATGGETIQSLTLVGQRPGTPLYMSPEQVRDDEIDHRTDIFSFGVVLYEMLTFKEPFRGRVVGETFDNILHKEPQPPREQPAGGDIPEELERVILRAIQKNPADRFQSMMDLVEELRLSRRATHG